MGKEAPESLRIDKWLWGARFFKTRSQASQAVAGGRVHVDGERVKASRPVKRGDTVSVSRGEEEMEVLVLGIPLRRGPASEAALLYEETAASIERRAIALERRKTVGARAPAPERRPNKKGRRQIVRLRRSEE